MGTKAKAKITRNQQLKRQRADAMRHQLAVSSAIDNLLNIGSSETLAAQAIQADVTAEAIQTIANDLYNSDPSFARYAIQTCSKTGQPITRADANMMALTIQTHGRERAHTLIRYSQLGHVHPAWLDTSPDARDKLLTADPIGYFAFAAKNLLASHWQLPPNAGVGNPSADEALSKRWDSHQQLRALYANLQDASSANILPTESLVTINRLLARFLGICKPGASLESNRGREVMKIANPSIGLCCHFVDKLSDASLIPSAIPQLIADFQQAIRDSIDLVMRIWAKHNLGKLAARGRPRLNPKQLEWLRGDMGGSAAFANQREAQREIHEYEAQLADIDFNTPANLAAKQAAEDNKYKALARHSAPARVVVKQPELPKQHGNKRVYEGKSRNAKGMKFSFAAKREENGND